MSKFVIVHDSQGHRQVYHRVVNSEDRLEYILVEEDADTVLPAKPQRKGLVGVVAVCIGFSMGVLKDAVIECVKQRVQLFATTLVELFIGSGG